MTLIAESAHVRQLVRYLDHIGLADRLPGLQELDALVRDVSAPMALPAHILVDLLASAALVLDRQDIGISFAEWLDPRQFGLHNILGESSTSYAERIRLSQRFRQLSNNALSFEPVDEGEDVVVIFTLHPSLRPDGQQYVEAVLAHSVRNARVLFSATWNPIRVEIAHEAAASIQTQKRFFRCPIIYGSDRDAFVVSRKDYYRPLPRGNENTIRVLEQYLTNQETRWPLDLCSQVENLIAAKLPGGGATLRRVAALLAMSPRTLQRRLAEDGQNFGRILASVRTQVVRAHLNRGDSVSLARLSHLLGFSEPSAAGRFIKASMGKSVRVLVRDHGDKRRRPRAGSRLTDSTSGQFN